MAEYASGVDFGAYWVWKIWGEEGWGWKGVMDHGAHRHFILVTLVVNGYQQPLFFSEI